MPPSCRRARWPAGRRRRNHLGHARRRASRRCRRARLADDHAQRCPRGATGRLDAEHGQEILRLARNRVTAGWTLPQLRWVVEHEPEDWARVRQIVFAKDFVRIVLSGDWVTDWIDAEGSLLLDAASRCWDPLLCSLVRVEPAMLPAVVAPTAVAGQVSAAAGGALRALAGDGRRRWALPYHRRVLRGRGQRRAARGRQDRHGRQRQRRDAVAAARSGLLHLLARRPRAVLPEHGHQLGGSPHAPGCRNCSG